MGFKQLINSKKLLSLLAVLILCGSTALMAQGNQDPATNATPVVDWLPIAFNVLVFLIICFAIAVVGKILRVYDLTQQIQGKKPMNWNQIMGICFLVFLILGFCGAYWSLTEQGSMTLPEAASKHGVKMDNMFTVTAIITIPVFFITQFLLFTFVFRYRGSDKRKAYYYPHNNTIEKIWTLAPAVVLTVLVVFGFFTWREITTTTDAKNEPASIKIEVTGHQFAWDIRYSGRDGVLGRTDFHKVSSTNRLGVDYSDSHSMDDLQADTIYLPVNKSVKFTIHAQDVIHSFYMPHFRVQMNAVPGMPTYFKFVPTITTAQMRGRLDDPNFEFLLYCNKICGGGHYNMQKVVRVVSEGEYNEWLLHQKLYLTPALKTELKMADAGTQKVAEKNRLALNN